MQGRRYAAHLGLAVPGVAGLLGFWPEGVKLYQYQLFFFSAIIGSLAREALSRRRRERASVASESLGVGGEMTGSATEILPVRL